MDNAKTQLAEKIKSANNILVTVSRNPSVDQLAACIGLALMLNKLDKHTAAVFSGQVPSTLEFLKPEETLEKNTDSLRDFIIALDKSKADKLRYKVEDDVVRIFITPYRTSISQADLEFSQGDFNVDLVIALGVRQQEDLDQAITAHGRILHDATVASMTVSADSGLGTINWHDPQASSLSELVTELGQALGGNALDNQIATALLTGIVAETNRFSNDKTSSQTMSASAALMAAGANQQLVATKLEELVSGPAPADQPASVKNPPSGTGNNGTLDIDHDGHDDNQLPPLADNIAVLPPVDDTPPPPPPPPTSAPAGLSDGPRMITEPPSMGGMLNANTLAESLDPATDPLSLPAEGPQQLLGRSTPLAEEQPSGAPTPPPPSAKPADKPAPVPAPPPTPPTPPPLPPGMSHASVDIPPAIINSEPTTPSAPTVPPAPPTPDPAVHGTLSDLEASVHSPHLNSARDEVSRALNSGADNTLPSPIQALNAQPLGDELHLDELSEPTPPTGPPTIMPSQSSMSTPPPADNSVQPPSGAQPTNSNAPPPVPPPIPFQFGSSDGPPM